MKTKTFETPVFDLERGTLFAGRYEIIEELGTGGMGKVYRVSDTRTKEEIALKLIKPEIAADEKTIDRFRNELTTARKIRHKNICGMYDLGEEEGSYYITMEYVQGEDLDSFIRRSKKLSVETTVSIGIQLCEGLAEAHKSGVVHRDLKPGNIMIDKDGSVRIMDFGIARSLKKERITGAGMMIGTPDYMSPEQAEGKDVDHRSDVFSLGLILYEMVTGEIPKVLDIPIPDDLDRAIRKCLERDTERRYQSAEDLRADLAQIQKSLFNTAKEQTRTPGLKKFLFPTLAITALFLIAIGIWRFFPWNRRTPALSEKMAIAILPFDDLSPEKDQEYLCDGLTETLINALSKINSLHVPARASSFLFKDTDKSYEEIGRKLSVSAILEGSVQKSEDRLRITTRLIDVTNESLIWSEQYDRAFGDIFEIQDDISLAIVDKLKIDLMEGEKADLAKRYTESAEAYQLYLRANHLRYRELSRDYHRAKNYYEQAIAHDPNFAAAYAGLAEIFMMLGKRGHIPRDEADVNAKTYVQRALEIDPDSSEAHSSMALILEVFDWNWEEAERKFRHAIGLNPNNFGAHYELGLLHLRTKKLKRAEEELLKALELDPLSYGPLVGLVRIYEFTGQKDKVREYNERIKEIRAQDTEKEDPIEALNITIAKRGRLPSLLGRLGANYATSGNSEDAWKLAAELEDLYKKSKISNIASALSWIMISLGEKEISMDWLTRSIEKRDTDIIEINILPWFDGLRDEPRFKKMLKEIGLE